MGNQLDFQSLQKRLRASAGHVGSFEKDTHLGKVIVLRSPAKPQAPPKRGQDPLKRSDVIMSLVSDIASDRQDLSQSMSNNVLRRDAAI